MSLAPQDIKAALDAMPDQERADLDAEARAVGLTPELALVARRLGMSAERYAAFAAVSNYEEAAAVRQRFADRDSIREEAARQLLVDQEKKRLAAEAGS